MTAPHDTIFALSSGTPPAAIAILRVSGPDAAAAVLSLVETLPPPRRATLRTLHHDGAILDHALLLWLPGPATATGEDMAEFHVHGGRAVVAAMERTLASLPGLRRAEAGEFTRRALMNGRIDLNAADALGDLLAAETESQRRAALANEGLSSRFEAWRARLLGIAAQIEGAIDLAEEAEAEDVALPRDEIATLAYEIEEALARPPAERLRDGIRVVLAGPVNAGKSTLLNRLAGREAAIATPVPGTTRDLIEVPVALEGRPFLFIDTAGLRSSDDAVEAIGVARAEVALAQADLVLWLGDDPLESAAPVLWLYPRADQPLRAVAPEGRLGLSALSGQGLADLRNWLLAQADAILPREGEAALNARHRDHLLAIERALAISQAEGDALLVAELVRQALGEMDRLCGRSGVEDVLDTMFSRFCVGK